MDNKRMLLIGVAAIGGLAAFILLAGRGEYLGCGGTEFTSTSQECSMAAFHMTPQVGESDPMTRKLCFQSLKSEGGCTVYKYRMAGPTIAPDSEDPEAGSEASAQYVNITYGSGCTENQLEGSLVEIIDHQRVEMALSGTPTRAPIPNTKSPEPLANGTCTFSDGEEAEFELFVVAQAE